MHAGGEIIDQCLGIFPFAAFPCLSNNLSKVLKKWFFIGWSKTFRCKAREIMRNEAYFTVRRNDEG